MFPHTQRPASGLPDPDELGQLCQKPAPPIRSDEILSSQGLFRALKVWKALKHPNLVELLGYSLGPEQEINKFILPCLTHGSIRTYLEQTTAGIAQLLGFVSPLPTSS